MSHQDQDEFRDESVSLWRIAFAPTVWAFHFLLCYAGGAVWCAKFGAAQGVGFLRISVLGLTVLALALIVWQGWRSARQWEPHDASATDLHRPESRHRFLGHAAFLLSIISGVGVIYVALPALFITSCR
ncbi:hypothetical protein [Paracoccus laeviglucosivorans]|uniref:Uncharacterized protein n=1 Tax=Paracoccus laeviglucosivorans TaxID=1197861 RepID=A0A521FBA1_9RHOB|nr:hypothetical protein [Paracoccus laeviglucosivorans]SMO92810.1 hypothetical protein SAMN06265221_11932 [Paracoccus laeviglucosivorans]